MASESKDRPTSFPWWIGVQVLERERGRAVARLDVRPEHTAGNGFMHAGAVATLADTACAAGCIASFPEGARNFTTLELKMNFVGTTRDGALRCIAEMKHGGRTTQVWHATVTNEDTGKPVALFTCTQMLLYPRE